MRGFKGFFFRDFGLVGEGFWVGLGGFIRIFFWGSRRVGLDLPPPPQLVLAFHIA